MVTDVKVRWPRQKGGTRAVALTGSDVPGAEPSLVWCRGEVIVPMEGTVVRVPGPVGSDVVMDLLGTGYAVEVFGAILPGQVP